MAGAAQYSGRNPGQWRAGGAFPGEREEALT